jgi:hypothetical protein
MSYLERLPYSDVVSKSKVVISGGTNTLITRVPWQPGSNKTYHLRKVQATTPTNVSGMGNANVVTFWDQDLSSATPSVRGNASTGALLTINNVGSLLSGAASTISLGLNECPRVRFEAGITVQATAPNTSIILELEMY